MLIIRVEMRGISAGLRQIWVEMPDMRGIRVEMQGVKVETYV